MWPVTRESEAGSTAAKATLGALFPKLAAVKAAQEELVLPRAVARVSKTSANITC
jgi:hypothetical protein